MEKNMLTKIQVKKDQVENIGIELPDGKCFCIEVSATGYMSISCQGIGNTAKVQHHDHLIGIQIVDKKT